MKGGARNFLLGCIAGAMNISVSSIDAAEIEATGFGQSYLIKISGRIEPGDRDKLITTIENQDNFPEAVRLDSTGGDIAASMALGLFVRRTMLATDTGNACDAECFLVWVGGVYRATHTPMNIRIAATDADQAEQLKTYLRKMEVPPIVADGALAATTDSLPDERLLAAVGGVSETHEAWLTAQCGELAPQLALDWQALQALKSMEDSLASMGMGGESMMAVGAETQQQAARAQTFSPEYREATKAAYTRITNCRIQAVARAREIVMSE